MKIFRHGTRLSKSISHKTIAITEVDEYMERIKDIGTEIKPERPRMHGKGRSICFYDFDNHLFELHTGTLDER